MDLINQFIENYKKKLTFYENLGRISSSQLEDARLPTLKSGQEIQELLQLPFHTLHSFLSN